MPSFFQFTQGNESRTRLTSDSSPLLGRFRAVPQESAVNGRRRRSSTLGLFSNNHGSVHVGYGALLSAAGLDNHDNGVNGFELEDLNVWQRTWRRVVDVWVEPKQTAVKRVVDVWWSRYGCLVLMPAALVCDRIDTSRQHGMTETLTSDGRRLLHGVRCRSPSTSSPAMMTTEVTPVLGPGTRYLVTARHGCRSASGSSSSSTTAYTTSQP